MIVRWIDSAGTDAEAHVTVLAQTPGFYRCVALFAQRLAERDPKRYDALLHRLEQAGDKRGIQAFLSALALSPRTQALLDARADILLENAAARLVELLNVLRTEQVEINVNVVDYARGRGMDIGSAILGGAMYGTPRFVVWVAALRFFASRISMRSQTRHCHSCKWPIAGNRRRIPALPCARTSFRRRCRSSLSSSAGAGATSSLARSRSVTTTRISSKSARSAVAYAADVDPAAMADYLENLREHGHYDARDEMLGHAGALGRALTDEVVACVVAVLCAPQRRTLSEQEFSELGLRPHKYCPSSDLQGPFLALLRNNEAAGIATVPQLTARALANYERDADHAELSRMPAHLRSLTFAFRGRAITVRGDERVYTWFCPGASDDSTVLTSALMALDTWAIESVRN